MNTDWQNHTQAQAARLPCFAGPLLSSPSLLGRILQDWEGCIQLKPVTSLFLLHVPGISTPEYMEHTSTSRALTSLFPRSKLACWEFIQGVSTESRAEYSSDFWPQVSTDLRHPPPFCSVGWNKRWEVELDDQQALSSIRITALVLKMWGWPCNFGTLGGRSRTKVRDGQIPSYSRFLFASKGLIHYCTYF